MTKAHQECIRLMDCLDCSGAMDFEVPESERKQEFSTAYLFGKARGKMFGVLVCKDQLDEEIVLKAFSSQYNGYWNIPGWVPPVLESAEFEKLVSPVDKEIKKLDGLLKADSENTDLKLKRKALSASLMARIQDLYCFRDFSGNNYSLHELWEKYSRSEEGSNKSRQGIPSGTGDCCAPKLLHYAAINNLTPVSLAEFYYGKENLSATKKHAVFYPPCKEKCQPLLHTLAHGLVIPSLTIYYKDNHIAVVEKPAGTLSVPGKGTEHLDSVAYRITRLFPESISQPAAHRLDMATSGLMVFGLTKEAHRDLSIQFQKQHVKKRYIAVVDGVPEKAEGRTELPFRLDPDNRPYQIYDEEHGKMGISEWKVLAVDEHPAGPRSRIRFIPKTGRTHQLRLHASHQKGLGCPIVGDMLYGKGNRGGKDPRLLLHAEYLEFAHPADGRRMEFYSKASF